MRTTTRWEAHVILAIPIALGLMWVSGSWSTDTFHYVVLSTGYTMLWLTKLTRRGRRGHHDDRGYYHAYNNASVTRRRTHRAGA